MFTPADILSSAIKAGYSVEGADALASLVREARKEEAYEFYKFYREEQNLPVTLTREEFDKYRYTDFSKLVA